MTHETAIIIQAAIHGGMPTVAIIISHLLHKRNVRRQLDIRLNGNLEKLIERALGKDTAEKGD